MSEFQDDLLAEISAYIASREIAESTFGRMAVNDSEFVDRLRRGAVTLKTIEKAKAFLRAPSSVHAADKPRESA